jgi:hypothetical protein
MFPESSEGPSTGGAAPRSGAAKLLLCEVQQGPVVSVLGRWQPTGNVVEKGHRHFKINNGRLPRQHCCERFEIWHRLIVRKIRTRLPKLCVKIGLQRKIHSFFLAGRISHNDWRSRSCERSEQFVRSPARRARFLYSKFRARPRERTNGAKRNVSRKGKDRAPQAHRRGAEWLRLVIRSVPPRGSKNQ